MEKNSFKVGDKVICCMAMLNNEKGTVTKIEDDEIWVEFDEPIKLRTIEETYIILYLEPTHITSCKASYLYFKLIEE